MSPVSPLVDGNWSYPTAIRFGAGRIAELPSLCTELGAGRPLLVTDPGLADLDFVKRALDALREAGLGAEIFTGVRANPVGAHVRDGVAAYGQGHHDLVIAMGGGSALDVGKAVALMVGQERPLWDFEDAGDNWRRVRTPGMARVVAVPTTAGTGSEVGRCSIIIDESSRTKRLIFHPKMMPAAVICDPEVTVGLPPHITAATGMDALSHNLEAFLCEGFHPMADGIALEGMRLVRRWLPAAVRRGEDLEARAGMMAASTLGAVAFQKGLGAMHALSHPVSAALGAHHGLANGVLMPYVLAFNHDVVREKLGLLARCLGLPGTGYDAVMAWVLDLREEIGIPHSLSDLDVRGAMVEDLAQRAAADPSAASNPRPAGATELAEIYRAAIAGSAGRGG